MKVKKVFIGGWVNAALKRQFQKELRRLNRQQLRLGAKKTSSSAFLQLLLLEGVALRKQPAKRRTPVAKRKSR